MPALEQGEAVLATFAFEHQPHMSRREKPYVFVLTDRAVLISSTKLLAVRDPHYFKRIPRAEIRRMRVCRVRSLGIMLLAVVLILLGGYVGATEATDYLRKSGGDWATLQNGISHPALVAVMVGVGLLLAARGRLGIIIDARDDAVTWKTPLVFERSLRTKAEENIAAIIGLVSRAGITLHDERSASR